MNYLNKQVIAKINTLATTYRSASDLRYEIRVWLEERLAGGNAADRSACFTEVIHAIGRALGAVPYKSRKAGGIAGTGLTFNRATGPGTAAREFANWFFRALEEKGSSKKADAFTALRSAVKRCVAESSKERTRRAVEKFLADL